MQRKKNQVKQNSNYINDKHTSKTTSKTDLSKTVRQLVKHNSNTNKSFCMFLQAFLADDNLGDSLDSVEALIKKHEDFENSFAAQEEKIKVYVH